MRVVVVDVGVATALDAALDGAAALWRRRVRSGTADLTVQQAMTPDEALAALEVGVEVANALVDQGADALLTGDMGIANTTASAALIAAFTGADPADVTGRGTGVDDETLHAQGRRGPSRPRAARADPLVRRRRPRRRARRRRRPRARRPRGFVLAGAARRVPVILDGVIAGAAALVAVALAPAAVDACIAGHRSAEPGHRFALEALGLRPLVELDLRLGEGTGAVLALPLVQAAAAALRDMATFDAAGVTDKAEQPLAQQPEDRIP